MATVKFRQLIDMAIGSPEPGHVNFYALHCLLNCIAEKLNILDDPIEYSKYESLIMCSASAKVFNQDIKNCFNCGVRTEGGSDRESQNNEELKGSATEVTPGPITTPVENEKPQEVAPGPIATTVENEEPQLHEIVAEVVAISPLPEEIEEVVRNSGTTKKNNNPTLSVISDENMKGPSSERKQSNDYSSNYRTSKIEGLESKVAEFEDLFVGVTIMKDQLMLAIEQLLLLTFLTLSKKPDEHRIHQLLDITKALRVARTENINIKSSHRFDIPEIHSLEWHLSDLELGEGVTEQDILEAQSSCTRATEPNTGEKQFSQHDLDGCLCYSPGKMLDQLLELKGDFCTLTNKVNEITARLVKQERQQAMILIEELQEQMRDVRFNVNNLTERLERSDIRLTNNTLNLENVKRSIDSLVSEKVSKAEVDIMFADKVDYDQLQRKVSLDQLLEVQCRIDKRFCEAFKQIKDADKRLEETAETLRQTLGFASIDRILQEFKQKVELEIQSIRVLMQKYVDATNDDCAAAGARIKVLQDLACLSCDTTCVMRTMEKTNVAKLPSAHASQSLSPLITYELGAIRKNGGLPQTRHAGGVHTTSTARERVDKVLLSGK